MVRDECGLLEYLVMLLHFKYLSKAFGCQQQVVSWCLSHVREENNLNMLIIWLKKRTREALVGLNFLAEERSVDVLFVCFM